MKFYHGYWRFIPPPRQLRWAAALVLLLPAGCQSYHSRPLTPGAVAQALKIPPWRQLRVAVEKTSAEQFPKTMLAPSQAITPNRAAALALILNPSLRALRDAHGEASAQLLQSGILTNPQLTASAGLVTGGYRTDTFSPYGIGVSWNLRQLIDRQARISSARYQFQQVDLEVAWREWQTAEAARLAVYAIAAAKAQLREARRAQRELDRTYQLARRASTLGLVTLLDLGLALHANQRAEALVLTSRQRLQLSASDLARVMGLPPGTVFTLSHSVHLPATARLPNVAQLEQTVASRRLDLLALRMGYQSQQEQLRAAVLRQFPSVNIGFEQASDVNNVHRTGFAVSIDLPIFDRNQGRIAQAKATRQILYDHYVARVFSARSDIGQAVVNIRSLRRRIRQAQSAVGKYDDLASRARQGLRAHSLDIGAYADAVEQRERARIRMLRLQYQLAQNLIALELASGDSFFTKRAPPTGVFNHSGETP